MTGSRPTSRLRWALIALLLVLAFGPSLASFTPAFRSQAQGAAGSFGPIGRGLYTGAGIPSATTLKAGRYLLGDRYIDTSNLMAYTCVQAGTAGTSLWSGGLAASGTAATVWQQIAAHDTAGSAEASFTWSGLNGDADGQYMIVGKVVSAGANDTIYLQPNADSTTSHYHTQEVVGNSATPSAGALQSDVGLEIGGSSADTGSAGQLVMHLSAKTGANRSAFTTWSKGATSTSRTVTVAVATEWTDTSSNISSLKVITSGGASDIGIGSHFELWAQRPLTIGQPTVVTKAGSGNGTDYSTAQTTYQDLDATNLAYTVTVPSGAKATITADGEHYQSTAIAQVRIAITDGTTILREISPQGGLGASSAFPWSFSAVFIGDGASHTFKLRFDSSNALDGANIVNASTTRRPEMKVRIEAAN